MYIYIYINIYIYVCVKVCLPVDDFQVVSDLLPPKLGAVRAFAAPSFYAWEGDFASVARAGGRPGRCSTPLMAQRVQRLLTGR